MTSANSWISAETEAKEADFRGVLGMHINICKGIMARRRVRPYLYADLYAGPGHLTHKGRDFDGSPLIAKDLLTQAEIPFEAIHYEADHEVAGLLDRALRIPTSPFDDPSACKVYAERCELGFARWLDSAGYQSNRYGLIYSDPIDDEINVDLLNKATTALPHVDLLSYVAATQYKRRRGQDLQRNGQTNLPLLSEHIKAVNKQCVLLRKKRAANQYTFVIWSNWAGFPEWERRGFHRLDSDAGQRILEQLTLTNDELSAKYEIPLPFGEVA